MAKRRPSRINYLGGLTILVALVLWELLVRTHIISFDYIPAPSAVIESYGGLISSGEMPRNLGHSLEAAVTGWIAAVIVGVAIGALLGLVRPVWRYSMATVEALRSLPIVAFVPVAVLLLGFTTKMEFVVAFYAALWPIIINTYGGIRKVDRRLIEVGDVLGLTWLEKVWKLQLPAATPYVIVGARLGLAVSFILTLVAEMIGNPHGLGFAIIDKSAALQPAQMFAYVVLTGLVGVAMNSALMALTRLVLRGQLAAAGDLG